MPTFVSLGHDCQAAHQIDRVSGAGRPAQFFDWLVTPHDALLRLLERGLAGFLDEIAVGGSHDGHHVVTDAATGIELFHDFPLAEPVAARLAAVRAKYAHLARRFRSLDGTVDLVFVRQVAQDQAREADARAPSAALARHFALFRLLVVADLFAVPRWSIPGTRLVAVHQPRPYVWTGSDLAWNAAFAGAGS